MVEFNTSFAHVNRRRGIAFFRINGVGLMIKAPRCAPLFSEREGYNNPILKIFDWRIFRLSGPMTVEEVPLNG